MGRIPPKAVLCAFFYAWVAVIFNGCIEPVNLKEFTGDEKVQEIIEKSDGTVNITQGSDSGLKAGNKKISGLVRGKYYMVEEWNDNGGILGVQFVSASGGRSKKLVDIGPVSGGEISGLTNRYHYRVRSAAPLPGDDMSYSLLSPKDSGTVSISNGAVPLLAPDDGSFVVYTLGIPPFPEAAEVPVTPAGAASSARRSPKGELIAMVGLNAVNDYVFYEKIDDATTDFFVLRVTAVPGLVIPPDEGDLRITVSFTLNAATKTFTLNPPSVTFSKGDVYSYISGANQTKKSVMLQDSGGIFDAGSIKWTYNAGQEDEITWTGATLDIDFADDKYVALLVTGEYTIYIEAAVEGVPYSSSIALVINN